MPSENLTWHLLPGTLLMNDTKVSSFTYFYQEYLNHRYQYQDFLLLTPGKLNTLKGVVEEIEKASKAFQENRPHLAALFKDLYALHKQNHHLALLADIRAKEITTLHELFRENAQHKETEYILNFYTQEYEVLPLWYKRMGHIIKAVMGKRTWKSLLPKAEAR
ncbi:hypothetical protein [Rufibacter radiotolerans]|nr:hypothetical protein [Rufibacter radiotolerans]